MKIVALKYGQSVFGENYIFCGGRRDVDLPISFTIYLIRTENKNILVDVGCDDGAGFKMSVFKKPVDVLREYGLSPEEITDVVITHAHHDHIEAIGHYKNATVHIEKNEYKLGRKYIPDGFKVNLIDQEYELTDRVKIKCIGGHSVGSCVVLADNFILCGDECYYEKCLTDKIPTGSTCDEQKSTEFVNHYGNGDYRPMLFHDPSILPDICGYKVICN